MELGFLRCEGGRGGFDRSRIIEVKVKEFEDTGLFYWDGFDD